MWGNVKRVLRWGFVIVFVLFVIFFIFGLVTYKAMSDMGNEKRKSRAEWEERAVEYFYKELQSCYGLEKGDYRVIEEKATYADRKAEFRFEVDGKEYYGYFIGTDYLTNYFSVSDSEELKAFVEERIKAS